MSASPGETKNPRSGDRKRPRTTETEESRPSAERSAPPAAKKARTDPEVIQPATHDGVETSACPSPAVNPGHARNDGRLVPALATQPTPHVSHPEPERASEASPPITVGPPLTINRDSTGLGVANYLQRWFPIEQVLDVNGKGKFSEEELDENKVTMTALRRITGAVLFSDKTRDKLIDELVACKVPRVSAGVIADEIQKLEAHASSFTVDTWESHTFVNVNLNGNLKPLIGLSHELSYQDGETVIQKAMEVLRRDGSSSFSAGGEKHPILALAGSPGRGKTRTLHEIAYQYHNMDKNNLALYITYNSGWDALPGKQKTDGCIPVGFWLEDIARRIAFAFYSLVLGPSLFPDQLLKWEEFCKPFIGGNWSIAGVIQTIQQYYCRWEQPPRSILLLVDELLTVTKEAQGGKPVDHHPALLEVLTGLTSAYDSFNKDTCKFDFIVSSLDETAFEGFITESGRQIQFIDLPAVTPRHVAECLVSLVTKCESPRPPTIAQKDNCAALAALAGTIPRHFQCLYEQLQKHYDDLGKLLRSGIKSNQVNLLAKMLQYVASTDTQKGATVTVPKELEGDPKYPQVAYLRTLLWAMSPDTEEMLSRSNFFSYQPDSKDLSKVDIPTSAITDQGFAVPVIASTSPYLQLRPCSLALVLGARSLKFRGIVTALLEMARCHIEARSGLQFEQFHAQWEQLMRLAHHRLYALGHGPESVPLLTFYHLSAPIPHPNIHKQELLSTERAAQLRVDVTTAPPTLSVVELKQFNSGQLGPERDALPMFSLMADGTQGFDFCVTLVDELVDGYLLGVGQQKVSETGAATKWSRQSLLDSFHKTKRALGGPPGVFLWTVYRPSNNARVVALSDLRNVLQLPQTHLKLLYGPFTD